MFKQIFPVLLMPLLLVGAGCASTIEETPDEPETQEEVVIMEEVIFEDGSYTLDTESSSIAWDARKRVGAEHNGTVQAQEGALIVEQGVIVGGSIVVDMTTIIDLDLTDERFNEALVSDLKSDNFFDTAVYPTALFAVSEVARLEGVEGANYRVDGTMTIKGIDNEVSFPAAFEQTQEGIRLMGTLTLDRTLWDIRFGSDKFFENLGDGLIEDEFTLDVDVLLRAQE
jgi:polyisoprenoid-binding protein YceI